MKETNRFLVKDVENAICGMDLLDKYGWATGVYSNISKVIAMCITGKKDLDFFKTFVTCSYINSMAKITKDTKIIIKDKNGDYYDHTIIAQIELELALNNILWDLFNTKNYMPDAVAHYQPTFSKAYKQLEEMYWEVVNINEEYCLANKDFNRIHFKMTD